MPNAIFGVPAFLFLALLFFAIVIAIAALRGGGGTPRSGTPGLSNKIQLLSAVLGILSFVMQVLQWMNVM